jgi:hypothetical protein
MHTPARETWSAYRTDGVEFLFVARAAASRRSHALVSCDFFSCLIQKRHERLTRKRNVLNRIELFLEEV